jgi:AraC-like DNA-binding protein
MMVKSELDKLGIEYRSIELGEVQLLKPITAEMKNLLKAELHKSGLELMFDPKAMLIEKIVNVIIEMVHYSEDLIDINFSEYLSDKMKQDYHKMSELFSKTKGITIEHFIILHKVERIKELIVYDELNITEISYKMNYSSVAHLSKQFKQVTGLTPTFFKSMANQKRTNIEDI